MKEKVIPNHHMGKDTGYELVDGVYHIAPLYQQQFDSLSHQRIGIDEMVKIVTSHAAKDLENLSKVNASIWKTLTEDIGLDQSKNWQYKSNGTVMEVSENLQK